MSAPAPLQLSPASKEPLLLLLALNAALAAPHPVSWEGTPEARLEKNEGAQDVAERLVKDLPEEVQQQTSEDLAEALRLVSLPFAEAAEAAATLNARVSSSPYMHGATPVVGDAVLWAGVRSSSVLAGVLSKNKGDLAALHRWLAALGDSKQAKAANEELKGAKTAKARANTSKSSAFDVFLPNAQKGQVVTRFPPEPSGYLHLGHTKAAILNNYFARQYDGKLLIRFDDTNPSKEKVEFEDSIIEDLELLGIKGDATSHTSDHFDELYRLVMQLIKQGDAYADDTLQEEMRAQRMDGIASARREATIEETMERFAAMSAGTDEGRRWCLRAKMSVDNPNKAMRDPVIYRCNVDTPHHRTGTTWKVYPTYDFACPVVDALEGITHALRTNEYRDRNPQYAWFLEKLQLRNVEIWDFGRLNFVYTLLSKRKLQWFVDNGHVSGWDDPRFPTVRGVRRRGMTIENMHQFILATGPSQQVINMEWDSIWAGNKRLIDPVVPRYTALEEAKVVKCTVSGVSAAHEAEVPRHKKNAELGNKSITFGPTIYIEQVDAASFDDNEEITLMDWGNAIVRKKTLAADGSVEALELEANLDGDFRTTKKKITWLAEPATRRFVEITLLDFDYLITKKKLEEEDKFEDFITPQSRFEVAAFADPNVAELPEGTSLQFERKGYYILDKAQGANGRREFIRIPDGRAATAKSKAAADDGGTEGRKAAAAEARAAAKKAKEEKKAKDKALNDAKKAKKADAKEGAAKAAPAKDAPAAKEAPAAAAPAAAAAAPAPTATPAEAAPFKEAAEAASKSPMYHMRAHGGDVGDEATAGSTMYSMRRLV